MTKTVDPELARKLKEKLETELIPRLQNQKIKTRSVVAVNIIALVDRQVGKGETGLEGEWEKLRGYVKDQPKALKLVGDLEVILKKYDDEIRAKAAEAEADEPAMRQAANGVIRSAVMAKLKSLQDADREEEAREAAAAGQPSEAASKPEGEEPEKS